MIVVVVVVGRVVGNLFWRFKFYCDSRFVFEFHFRAYSGRARQFEFREVGFVGLWVRDDFYLSFSHHAVVFVGFDVFRAGDKSLLIVFVVF